jgi:hypothetical protein
MKKAKDKFKENACEFKNETACEEELEEEDIGVDKAEEEHFEEEDEDKEEAIDEDEEDKC